MDQKLVSQVVAMLVVLAALVRWLPVDDAKDALGRGDPLRALQLDRYLVEFGERQDLSPLQVDEFRRAYLLQLGKPDAQFFQFWLKKLMAAREIVARRTPDTLVQFKGVPRNVLWPLMYLLYPVRTVGVPAEHGSQESDPTLPGVTDVMTSGLVRWEEMDPETLQEARRRKRERAQQPGPVPDR